MTDWSNIEIRDFDTQALEADHINVLVGRLVLDRLPFAFTNKREYLMWRNQLADGLEVDGRDVLLVGSAATGRSLSPRSHFHVFTKRSDLDIAVISPNHFDQAWDWFRRVNPQFLPLDDYAKKLFQAHRKHYVFEGVIAAEFFLQFLPFGSAWLKELQRTEAYLPDDLQGRRTTIRIYRDSMSFREAQARSLLMYRKAKGKHDPLTGVEG